MDSSKKKYIEALQEKFRRKSEKQNLTMRGTTDGNQYSALVQKSEDRDPTMYEKEIQKKVKEYESPDTSTTRKMEIMGDPLFKMFYLPNKPKRHERSTELLSESLKDSMDPVDSSSSPEYINNRKRLSDLVMKRLKSTSPRM